ncbi:hypothetical protein O0I10_009783 [Lichtheimia ornata]|uniref:Uncharacterized protein n=1 Tax=Lichtheimia ornata TaxID=688661 RepID=A0AAD7UXA9_9FUNG|nr:uncharacterized protein O0I10_009783 [Lichtheimia ornata]KAJ8654601.1 hypothetical protein O0I10_009783 [Lichtheimia ornata]
MLNKTVLATFLLFALLFNAATAFKCVRDDQCDEWCKNYGDAAAGYCLKSGGCICAKDEKDSCIIVFLVAGEQLLHDLP